MDDEAGASDAKVIALQNLHSQKIRALMKSIEKYKVEVKKLSSQNRESSRSRQIQGLQNQLRSAELVSDVLKETLTKSTTPMSPTDVNDLVIRKTLGGPKRFRPKTREELQNQVNDLELKYKRAFAKAETTKLRLKEEQANSRQLNQSLSNSRSGLTHEGKVSTSSFGSKHGDSLGVVEGKEDGGGSYGMNGMNASDHGARVVELLGQLEEMRAQTEVKDRQIRMYVSKVEGLHEGKRELTGYKDKYERSKSKNAQQLNEIETMHQESIALRRKLERTKENALRLEAEVDVQKEEGMAANQDVGRQRLKDMQKISELTEDLEEVRSKLDASKKKASQYKQKRLIGEQTLESSMVSLKSNLSKFETENDELKNDNRRLQQKLDREMEENQKALQHTTNSTSAKIVEQERKIKKLNQEKEHFEKEIVRHETVAKNLESQLNRSERASKDRMDKLELLNQQKETELRELEKERGELKYKQADAKRDAKEAESRGESGVKAIREEMEELKIHLEEEINARNQLQNTCKLLEKSLTAAKMKIRQLQKVVDAAKRSSGGQKKSGSGPAARTPAAARMVVDQEEGSEDEDHDAIMNA